MDFTTIAESLPGIASTTSPSTTTSTASTTEIQNLRVALEEAARGQRDTIDSLNKQLQQAREQHKVRRLSHGMHSVSSPPGGHERLT